MVFGRRNRTSGLMQTAARTAVITGTAAATSSAVHGRAARRQAQRDSELAPVPSAQQVTTAPASADDVIAKLERLANLHASGALTDDEFALLKRQAMS